MAISSFIRLLLFTAFLTGSNSVEFIAQGFNSTALLLHGATVLKPTGALRLTDTSFNAIGRAFYPDPIPISRNGGNGTSSFSTCFVFHIRPANLRSNHGGYGLSFIIAPTPNITGESEHYMGVFTHTNDGNSSNHILMVEFDTVIGLGREVDSTGNHVGININGMRDPAITEPIGYFPDAESDNKEDFRLEEVGPVQVWIDFDGSSSIINLTLAPVREVPTKPGRPLISKQINLSDVFLDNMYIGFSAATGAASSSSHDILGWSFKQNGIADQLDLSLLPTVPNDRPRVSSEARVRIALIAASSTILFIILAVIAFLYRRARRAEDVEDWELDCPHRFKYQDLHKATKGFQVTEILGVGDYGAVYKGILPTTGAEVAVKKIISNDPLQGTREFAAEVESLGRLRHKNLVNLHGWCKKKNNLLLVYEYVSNGSLDSLLYNPRHDVFLPWDQRFSILKGVASGLLYLHEEWEKVVIHRDVKSSNVLIDKDMNAKLGDFGLARLHDRGKTSQTTNVVGTVGYIAPELTRTGKPSTNTDVFAFGTLLLEVACGKPPVISDASRDMILSDWVMECWRQGNLLEAADERLGTDYSVPEMELVLSIGMLCSHPTPEARPDMRTVVKYLNGDESLPEITDISDEHRRRAGEITSRFLAFLSDNSGPNTTSSKAPPNSFGTISLNSFDNGR